MSECDNCPDHTGQVEKTKAVGDKMNLLITLIVLQLGATVSFGGMVYNKISDQTATINALGTTVAVDNKRLEVLESNTVLLRANDDEYRKRLDMLERGK